MKSPDGVTNWTNCAGITKTSIVSRKTGCSLFTVNMLRKRPSWRESINVPSSNLIPLESKSKTRKDPSAKKLTKHYLSGSKSAPTWRRSSKMQRAGRKNPNNRGNRWLRS